jgi:hypothetical protein
MFLNKSLDLYRQCSDGVLMCPQCGSEGSVKEPYKPHYPCPLCHQAGEVTPEQAAEYKKKGKA